MENQDVAKGDITCAFVQTDMPNVKNNEDEHVMIEGKMAELLAKLDPLTYEEYVHTHHGQVMIHVKLKKSLYGTLKADLLLWKKLSSSLTREGFLINPYDWCVSKKHQGKNEPSYGMLMT